MTWTTPDPEPPTTWTECETGSVIVTDPNARSIETKDEGILVERITNGLNFLGDGVIVSKSPTFPNQVDVTFISGVGNGIAKGDPFVVGDIMAAESDVGDGAAETIGVSATDLTGHLGDADIHFSDAPNDANQYARSGLGWAIVDQGVVTFNGRFGAVVPLQADYSSFYAPIGHVGATGVAHGVASGVTNGFMSSTDKSKLDGITPGAEPNTVDSVFTRTGAIVAQPGDYDAIQIDNTPDGRITATDVQAAIKQLDDQKPEISNQDTLPGHMQLAVLPALPGTPDPNTIYFITV